MVLYQTVGKKKGVAAREVWVWFQDHLDALLESMRSFRFDQFEMNIRTFWSNLSGSHREVVHAPAIAGLMARADAIVYDVRAGASHFRASHLGFDVSQSLMGYLC